VGLFDYVVISYGAATGPEGQTYHTVNEAEIGRHHVAHVVRDKHPTHVQLRKSTF